MKKSQHILHGINSQLEGGFEASWECVGGLFGRHLASALLQSFFHGRTLVFRAISRTLRGLFGVFADPLVVSCGSRPCVFLAQETRLFSLLNDSVV